jgi:NADPH:quinone reductase-like Zn-dependent oxidoreductase
MRNIRLQGVFVGHHRAFEALVAHLHEQPFRPVVDRVFPLERARDAIQHLISGQHVGKVCLTVD